MTDLKNNGFVSSLGAYLLWGLLPLYWKQLSHIPALEILSHRIVWSMLFVSVLLILRKNWDWLSELKKTKTLLSFIASTLLLSTNWLIYIWGVNNNFIVETSLGYFINPLVNVLLGVLILKESMNGIQWSSIALAAFGVAYLTFEYGRVPWIALVLAFSFGVYGLLRKQAKLRSLQGLGVETAFVSIPALIFLSVQPTTQSIFSEWTIPDVFWLLGAGVVTSVPLILFAHGAQRINLSTLGILQYLAPTIQLMVGVFVYKEAFERESAIGFGFIWLALAMYTFEYIARQRKTRRLKKAGTLAIPNPK